MMPRMLTPGIIAEITGKTATATKRPSGLIVVIKTIRSLFIVVLLPTTNSNRRYSTTQIKLALPEKGTR